jgi:transglutaminase-like putative cysteine protease
MARRVHAQISAVAGALALTAATGIAGGPDSTEDARTDVGTAARRLSAELLDTGFSDHRPPLTADAEHARTVDPVLTEEAVIWIHEGLPAPPLTVMGGRVFTYRDVPYDPLEAPMLKIRAIDDHQRIPFLVRVVFRPTGAVPSHAAVEIVLPAPLIFHAVLSELNAWVGDRPAQTSAKHSVADASFAIRIPLAPAVADRPNSSVAPITVIVEGVLLLAEYHPLAPRRFAPIEDFPYDPEAVHLSELQIGLDVGDLRELQRILEIADSLVPKTFTDYEKVVAVTSWVGRNLQYRKSVATRTPLEALDDQSGDCDDHSALTVALLRAMGIAARRSSGLLYNLDILLPHVWVEAGLPTRDGDLHWFIVDPTLAGASRREAERSSFVQFKDRILLYRIRPVVTVDGAGGGYTTDVLLNWRAVGETPPADGAPLDDFVDTVITRVDRDISRMAENLTHLGLLQRRLSSTVPGSPYLIVDRAIADSGQTRLRLWLENEERIVLELTAPAGRALDSESDLETIELMMRTYSDLDTLFFGGLPAHYGLELVFERDRHTDRLHTVSLRFGRYLVEHFLDRILTRLSKSGLLTEQETSSFSEVAKASDGKNLYVLQELARQQAR